MTEIGKAESGESPDLELMAIFCLPTAATEPLIKRRQLVRISLGAKVLIRLSKSVQTMCEFRKGPLALIRPLRRR